jgi:hypothetical protein
VDAIKFLTRQHRRIESLFARYRRAPQRSREALFGLIERALVPHSVLEEMHVYPEIRERVPGGQTLSEHAIDEHANVERVVEDMKSLDAYSSAFDSQMRWVIDTVQHHMQEEEGREGLFAMLRAAMTRTELEDLGRTLRRAADMTPTRAHPLAPDHPPLNKVLGMPVAIVDRTLDRITGRAAASEAAGEDVTHAARRGRRAATRATRSRRRPAGSTRKRASTSTRTARSSRGATSRGRTKRAATASRRRPKQGARRQTTRTTRTRARRR